MVLIAHITLVFTLVVYNCNGQEFVPDIPEECLQKGFCESVPNYPTEQVEKVLSELGEEAVKKFQMDSPDQPELVGRQGGMDLPVELCFNSQTTMIYPQALPDKDKKWYYVLNRKQKPIQGFYVEFCGYGSACTSEVEVPEGYKGTCIQKFLYRYTHVLGTDGKADMKLLKMPSCCSCVTNFMLEFVSSVMNESGR